MPQASRRGWTRRQAVATGIGAVAAALVAPTAVTAQGRGIGSGGGIGGGGTVNTATAAVTFSLFAARVELPGGKTAFIGRVQWVDPSWQGVGLSLESTAISSYRPMPDNAQGREIKGTMTMNGSGSFPFVMRAIDNGPPGSGKDTAELTVGAAVGAPAAATTSGTPPAFTYQANGPVTAGDIELVTFQLPL